MKKLVLLATGIVSFFLGWLGAQETPRFDQRVRNDFFAGFTGDDKALQRGLQLTEKILAANPKHAEAMVWRGTGLFSLAGTHFRSGDGEKGMQYYQQGVALMDEAVRLEPENLGVRIPRGAISLSAVRSLPPEIAPQFVKRAAADYGKAYELQKGALDKLGVHPRGELLLGLADIYELSGDAAKSKAMLETVVKTMQGTVYGQRAAKWLTDGTLPFEQRNCIGCHVSGQ